MRLPCGAGQIWVGRLGRGFYQKHGRGQRFDGMPLAVELAALASMYTQDA